MNFGACTIRQLWVILHTIYEEKKIFDWRYVCNETHIYTCVSVLVCVNVNVECDLFWACESRYNFFLLLSAGGSRNETETRGILDRQIKNHSVEGKKKTLPLDFACACLASPYDDPCDYITDIWACKSASSCFTFCYLATFISRIFAVACIRKFDGYSILHLVLNCGLFRVYHLDKVTCEPHTFSYAQHVAKSA